MHLKTGIKVSGWVTITITHAHSGRKIVAYDGPNQITNTGLTAFGTLLAQQAKVPTDLKVTSIKFGTSSTAATASQTDILGSLILDKSIVSYTEDVGGTPGTVAFETTLGTAEGNGNTINELGLMTADGTMIARRVTPAIPKTNLISVGVNWHIIFSST